MKLRRLILSCEGFRYPASLRSRVSRLPESSAVVDSCLKSSTKVVKNLPRSTRNATQAFAPHGKWMTNIIYRCLSQCQLGLGFNSDFCPFQQYHLGYQILPFFSFSIKPNIEFGMGSHITPTEKSSPHNHNFLGFFEDARTFRFRQERGLSPDRWWW